MGLHRADPERPGPAFWAAVAGLAVVLAGAGYAIFWALSNLI